MKIFPAKNTISLKKSSKSINWGWNKCGGLEKISKINNQVENYKNRINAFYIKVNLLSEFIQI